MLDLPTLLRNALRLADEEGRPPRELNRAATPICSTLRDVPREVAYLAISSTTEGLELLPTFTRLEVVWVSHATGDTLASVSRCPAVRAVSLQSTKIETVAPLRQLVALQHLAVCDAPRLVSVDAPPLRTLMLWDVPRLRDLDSIAALVELIGLQLGGAMWRTHRLPSLAPLARLARLRYLDLPATRAETDSLAPLAALLGLQQLFLPNVYPIEQFAALAASLPGAKGDCLQPHWRGTLNCPACGSPRLLETGRGGRFVCPRCAPDQIAKRVAKFEELVSRGGFQSPEAAP